MKKLRFPFMRKRFMKKFVVDPYNIDDISIDDLLLNKEKLIVKSILRIIAGLIVVISVIIICILSWDNIFYSPGRWLI